MGLVDMILQRMYGISPAGAQDSRGPLGKLFDVDPGHYDKMTGDVSLDAPQQSAPHSAAGPRSPYAQQQEFDNLVNKHVKIADLLPNIKRPDIFTQGVKMSMPPSTPAAVSAASFKGTGLPQRLAPVTSPPTGAFSGNDQTSIVPAETPFVPAGADLPIPDEPLAVPTKFGAGIPTFQSNPLPQAKSHNLAAMIFNRLRGQ